MSPRHVAALLLALAPASFGCHVTWVDLTPDAFDVEETEGETGDGDEEEEEEEG